jgi:hypothetical protein
MLMQDIESLDAIEPTKSKDVYVISAFRDTHDFSTVQAADEEE